MSEKKVEFTKEQKKVIDLRDRSILVSAAAGSGKTAVLVERIIRLITDEKEPVDIDTLLVVTFTRAAAAQMKDKIAKAILNRLEDDPENINLQRQSALVHNANITTIDAFCQYVLKNSLTESEADPGFRIAEEGENKLLESDVLDRLIEDLYTEADEDFMYMADHLVTGADDSALTSAIYDLYSRSQSGPWPDRWLKEHSSDYDCPDGNRLPDRIHEWVMKTLTESITAAFKSYKSSYEASLEGGLNEKNIEIIKSEYNIVSDIYNKIAEKYSNDGSEAGSDRYTEKNPVSGDNKDPENEYEELRRSIASIEFAKFSNAKGKDEDPDLRKHAKAKRDEGKSLMSGLKDGILSSSYVNLVRHTVNSSRIVHTLCDVTLRYIDELARTKKEKKILSFSDCEHQALDILVKCDDDKKISFTDAAAGFRSYFSYVFIDEYQDSNLVQELILSAVSGESEGIYNRFMVGDIKQSIYRFRQADPDIFAAKYDEYGYDDPHRTKIDLNCNFRSRKHVLNAANALFERIMNRKSGSCDYDNSASLKYGADFPCPDDLSYNTELIFADPCLLGGPTDRQHLEGEVIARRIRELMETGFMVRDEDDPDNMRPVRYSDIVILYRSGLDYAMAYKEVLESHSIPAHLTGSEGYFSTFEISTLMNLLRVIVNPLQDIYFYGAMEGLFGGFLAEEISSISIRYRESLPDGVPPGDGYLYNACRYILENADGATYESRLAGFIERLDRYRDMSEYMPVEQLLESIMEESDYKIRISAMHGGDRRLANVGMLLKKASDFGTTSYFGLYNFIRYIDNLKKSNAMDAEADIIDEGADVVRIMTTHKSKGLEFPVCFVTRLGNEFNLSDAKGRIISDYKAGIGIRDTDTEKRLSYDTVTRQYVADYIRSRTLAEEMRIIYVAMTRAMEKLIMICTNAGKQDKETGIYRIERPKSHVRYADWYLECICDELGSDGFIPDMNGMYLPGLHIDVSLSDISEEDTADANVSEGVEASLKIKLLMDRSAGTGDEDEIYAYLSRLADYKYPHNDLKGLYTKTSVSELKAAAMHDEEEPVFEMYERPAPVPAFISGNYERSGATVRGTAFHRIMELMDFPKMQNADSLHNTVLSSLDGFEAAHSITRYEREIFDVRTDLDRVCAFLGSETAGRMAKAASLGKLYREAPFIMGIGADEVDSSYPAEETVLIQGIIDAYWIEDGEAVILDYKTDRVDNAKRLTDLYKTQLDLYEKALLMMHIPVKEKLIYSFELGETIRV